MKSIILEQTISLLPADIQTPISLYLGLVGEKHGILLESASVEGGLGRYSFILWDFRLSLICQNGILKVQTNDKRLSCLHKFDGTKWVAGVKQTLQVLEINKNNEFKLPAITRALYGYFGYGMSALFEPTLSSLLDIEDAKSHLVLPGQSVLYDHLHHRCYYISLDGKTKPNMEPAEISISDKITKTGLIKSLTNSSQFQRNVQKVKELIKQGECIQVVISSCFTSSFVGDEFILYRRMRQLNPSPYMFFLKLPEISIVGSSPELLIRCEQGILETHPIAGTRPRDKCLEKEQKLIDDLLQDPKELAEHVMLVDLGRNDLGRIAASGSVSVEKFMEIEKFSHVMHLTSQIKAKLKKGLDVIDVLISTFPAGTLSGAPKIRAMEIISELEVVPRHFYGGAIGWLGLDKESVNMDTGIIIRSLWVEDSKVFYQAGAGITHDSIPENEWIEVNNKSRIMEKVLYGTEETDVFSY